MNRPNQAARMNDPAGGVPQQLLPHMHLVSNYRYPLMPSITTETAVEYLLTAPKVVREIQPMHWTFLDAPQDGTVMLVWQPLNHLGTNFASDGYVWADPEQVYSIESRGYTVEVWIHRCGYHPPNETVATHSRRRYRLTPSKTPNPNVPPCDPSLWIVHYSKAPPSDHIPANRIPIIPQVQNILAQRRFLQSQGQLARKEFMLHDRNSWPTVNLPSHVGQQNMGQQPGYANFMGRQQPGAPFYQPQQGLAGPQAKQTRGHRGEAAAAAGMDHSLEDEEVSTGDLLDMITPRDISRMRYKHHHEWMEEIFASPYKINQIVPVDLGLGRKGELEALTSPFFEAPLGPFAARKDSKDSAPAPVVGRMQPEKAEEFTNAASKKVADMTAEIEQMKKDHARRLEKVKRGTAWRDAELKLRDAVVDPADVGTEFWRIEGNLHLLNEDETESAPRHDEKPKVAADDILRSMQEFSGRTVIPERGIICVDRGGYQERVSPARAPVQEDVQMNETETAANAGQTANVDQTQAAQNAAKGTTAQAQGPSPGQAQAAGQGQAGAADVEMGGVDQGQPSAPADQDVSDWVVVDKDAEESKGENQQQQQQQPQQPTTTEPGSKAETPAAVTAGGTPGSNNLQGLTPGDNNNDLGGVLETSNFDDAAGFSHMDSAGDALAAYGEQNDGLDLGDLDNSAFGAAFHPSEGEGEHHDTDGI